jgi:hypothetical protein
MTRHDGQQGLHKAGGQLIDLLGNFGDSDITSMADSQKYQVFPGV